MIKVDSFYSHEKLKDIAIYVHSYSYENAYYTLNVVWVSKKSKKLIIHEVDKISIPEAQLKEWNLI